MIEADLLVTAVLAGLIVLLLSQVFFGNLESQSS